MLPLPFGVGSCSLWKCKSLKSVNTVIQYNFMLMYFQKSLDLIRLNYFCSAHLLAMGGLFPLSSLQMLLCEMNSTECLKALHLMFSYAPYGFSNAELFCWSVSMRKKKAQAKGMAHWALWDRAMGRGWERVTAAILNDCSKRWQAALPVALSLSLSFCLPAGWQEVTPHLLSCWLFDQVSSENSSVSTKVKTEKKKRSRERSWEKLRERETRDVLVGVYKVVSWKWVKCSRS